MRLSPRREVLFLLFYVSLSILATIGPGASLGYSSVVLPVLTSNTSSITLSATEAPLFASLPILCQIVGNILSLVTLKYGRRCAIVIAGVTCSLGWIVIASSYTVTQLLVGRMLTGIAVGLCGPPVSLYLAEISTPTWRELLAIVTTVPLCFGIVIVYFLGCLIRNDWRFIAALCIVPPTLSVLCTVFVVPESPVWLLEKGQKKAARTALLRIRGLRQETIEFQEEFARMVSYNELRNDLAGFGRSCRLNVSSSEKIDEITTGNVWSKLRNILRTASLPEVWKPLVILNFYFLFQQFSGLYVITAYAVDMIVVAKVTVDPFVVTVTMGIIQLVMGTISAYYSARIGRRTTSIVSGVGMSISLGVLGVYIQFFVDANGVLPLACVLVFVASGSFGFMTVPTAMIVELYPTKYTGVLGHFTVFFASLFSFAAVQLYPAMVTQDENATMYFYCTISVVATFYLTAVLPETRGKTKTQIEEAFREKSQVES